MDEQKSQWPELESGLPNDIDGWMVSCHFGKNENYMAAVTVGDDETMGTQFMFDVVDENGEIQGSIGYSVGTGWIVSEDKLEISHPKRRNVVRSSRYGTFQERVLVKLGVDMSQYGVPTKAPTWDGLGFHWMQEKMKTVGGKEVDVLMPTIFLGKHDVAAAKVAEPTSKLSSALEATLADLAAKNTLKNFQLQAMKNQEALANDDLMASILNDGPKGFWATHQKK